MTPEQEALLLTVARVLREHTWGGHGAESGKDQHALNEALKPFERPNFPAINVGLEDSLKTSK